MYIFLRKSILKDEKFRLLLHNSRLLKPIVAYEIGALVNLCIFFSGHFPLANKTQYTAIILGACALMLGMHIYIVYQSAASAEHLLEHRQKIKILEEQYARQLQHYESYRKHMESFRAFKHDFQAIMASLRALISAREIESALELIQSIHKNIHKQAQSHKKYSDSVVLDALLQDLVASCAEKEISLSFKVFSTQDTGLSMLDSIRIFYNLTRNAVEACEKVPVAERFIKISTSKNKHWATLEVANAYDGMSIVTNGNMSTTKPEQQEHGLGLGIVKEIAEELGGFVVHELDSEAKTFLIRAHIPRLSGEPL
ncbi:GHKL domain-containing protein [Oscillospiraceae bacterium MB08-C2-2]|nr:GHKL domain-containing protein [Oscillospiraceae bacterium MB08-C2-2]